MSIIEEEYEAKKKSMLLAYINWFLFGWLGGHRFYMGRIISGLGMLALILILVLSPSTDLKTASLLALGIWVIVDAFLIPKWVRERNNALIDQLLELYPEKEVFAPVEQQPSAAQVQYDS